MTILQFDNGQPNASLEINDLVYWINNVQNQWTDTMLSADDIGGISTYIFIGSVSSILLDNPTDGFTITVEEPAGTTITPPTPGEYVFFAKNSLTEVSTLKGYYGQITMENNSRNKAELYSVGAEITESSK